MKTTPATRSGSALGNSARDVVDADVKIDALFWLGALNRASLPSEFTELVADEVAEKELFDLFGLTEEQRGWFEELDEDNEEKRADFCAEFLFDHGFHGLLASVLIPVNEGFRYTEDGKFKSCRNHGFGHCHTGLAYGNTMEELSVNIVQLQEAFFAEDMAKDKAKQAAAEVSA